MLDLAQRALLAVWSILFWSLAFSWMLVGALATMLLLVVGLPYQKVHMWVTAPSFSRCVGLSLTKVRLHYHPAFDPERRSVFAQNHINLLDGHLAATAIPHAFSGLMNSWQFKIPIYGWLMALSKGIPVRRGRRDETIKQISAEARKRREIGMSVLVFPEGHRTLDGKIATFRRGVFLMARNAGYPVVPIAVRGMYEVNRKGTWIFNPMRTVDVFVGPQFETEGIDDKEIGAFAQRVRAWTVHCMDEGRWPETTVERPEADPPAAANNNEPADAPATSAAR